MKPLIDALGRTQETNMLTEKGLYKVLFSSRKDIAKKFQSWVFGVIREIRLTGKYELQEKEITLQKQLQEKDTKHTQDLKLNRQEILLHQFDNKNCVYLCEVDFNLIKIGSSQDINNRKADLKKVFGSCIFLDIFECKSDFREIEQCILSIVRTNLYKEPINGHVSKEVVLLNENTFNYNQLVTIVKNTVNTFINKELEMKKLENEGKK